MVECDPKKQEGRVEEMAEEFRARARKFFPPEFRQHMMNARREFLLGIRSLIDARIEALERAEKAAAKKATKVKVE